MSRFVLCIIAMVPVLLAYLLIGYANYAMVANFNFVGPLLVVAFYWYLRRKKAAEEAGRSWPWIRRIGIILICL